MRLTYPPSSQTGPEKTRVIRCPACGGPSRYAADNPARPFCSDRCRNLDLGAWASEGYRVPARPGEDDPQTDSSGGDAAH